MICYLGYPIDMCTPDTLHPDTITSVRSVLATRVAVFEPGRAWSLDPAMTDGDDLDRLSIINFEALDRSDFMLALAPLRVPSVGVPIETYHVLNTLHRKVALWLDSDNPKKFGAVWTHLIREFPDQVKLLPKNLTYESVLDAVRWAAGADSDSEVRP